MEYWLQNVFTDREVAKLVALAARRDPKAPPPAPEHVRTIRSFVRLFAKSWVVGKLVHRLPAGKELKPVKFSTAIVLCSLAYRYIHKKLLDNPQLTNFGVAAPLSGAIAGYILSQGLPPSISSYVAVFIMTKVLEWGYNAGDDNHLFDWKPQLLGTWTLFPVAFAQLFHSLIMSPGTCPNGFKRLMIALSNGAFAPQMETDDTIRSIAHASVAEFPEFRSTLIYQLRVSTEKLVTRAHPGNDSLISALIHPTTDSDVKFFLDTVGNDIFMITKFLLPIFLVRAYMTKRSYSEAVRSTLRVAVTYSLTAASAIAGIKVSQRLLGRKLSPTVRFRLIGLVSGLWAVLNQESGRAQFLYASRLALLSLIPANAHGRISRVLLPLSTAAAFVILNKYPDAITQRVWRKIGNWMQSGTWSETLSGDEPKEGGAASEKKKQASTAASKQ